MLNVQRNANTKNLNIWFLYPACNRISSYDCSLNVQYNITLKGGGGARRMCFVEKQLIALIN